MKKYIFLIIGMLFGVVCQGNAAVKFSTLSLAGEIKDIFYLKGTAQEPVQIPSSFFSQSYSYEGISPIQFYKKDQNGENIVIASAVIPAGASRISFVFSQNLKEPGKFNIFSLDGDFLKYGKGDFQFLNLSNHEIFAALNKKVAKISPFKSAIIDGNEALENESALAIKFASNNAGKAELFYTIRRSIIPDARTLYIIYEKAPGKFTTKSFQENVTAVVDREKSSQQNPETPPPVAQ